MNSLGARLTLVSLVLLGLTTVSYAQNPPEMSGTVQRVDVPTRTIYLTDGRAVRVDPGTRLYAGNREVRLSDVQPGWVFAGSGSATPGTPSTVVIQPPVSPAPTMASAASRIDATGIVASVDPITGTIALQDGRILQMGPATTLWQQVTMGAIAPGSAVFVRNAAPIDFRPASAPPNRPFQMGTISSVDAANGSVVLGDGTVLQLRPGSPVTFNGQPLAVTGLRPGDEVVIGVPAGSTVAVSSPRSAVSALPRQERGVIYVDSLYVVRRPESP